MKIFTNNAMKSLFMMVCLCIISSSSFGQKNIITFTPIKTVGSILCKYGFRSKISYERVFSDNKSIGVVGSIYNYKSEYYDNDLEGYKISMFYRYYYKDSAPFGYYLHPQISFGDFNRCLKYVNNPEFYFDGFGENSIVEPYFVDFYSMGISIHTGRQIMFKDKILLDFSIGFQYFPIDVPNTQILDGKVYELYSNGSLLGSIGSKKPIEWYLIGPGSIIDAKMVLGFAF